MKIVNKKKFIRFICILATLIVSTTYIAHTTQNDWTTNCTITEIYVTPGDTLWEIAEEHKPNGIDTREYIYEIKRLNNMSTSDIHEGDAITIYERGEN